MLEASFPFPECIYLFYYPYKQALNIDLIFTFIIYLDSCHSLKYMEETVDSVNSLREIDKNKNFSNGSFNFHNVNCPLLKAVSDDTIFAHDCLRFASRGVGRNLTQSCAILPNRMQSRGIGDNYF